MSVQFVTSYVAGAQYRYKEALCIYPTALVINLCSCEELNFGSITYRLYWPQLFCEVMLLNKLWNWFLYELCPKKRASQAVLKITRPVVLWLNEMVLMVFRRGSESNIKSDLAFWAQFLFKHAFKHFYGINTTKRYLFHLHKVHKIKLNFKRFNSYYFSSQP